MEKTFIQKSVFFERDLNVNQGSRLHWPDNTKAIAIFAVFLSHYLDLVRHSTLLAYLTSFNVPIFFIIGGMFFKDVNQNFKHIAARKAMDRIIPYAVFGLATYLIWSGLNYMKSMGIYDGTSTGSADALKPLVGLIYAMGAGLHLARHSGFCHVIL